MPDKPVRTPGPDHPIAIEPHPGRIVVKLAGETIGDTRSALVLREASYSPVFYVPRKDVDMAALVRSGHASYCPYKGDASYYSIPAGGDRTTNAVWSYEEPHPSVGAIRDHLAFYPDQVDVSEEPPH